ncbi:MAG: hypothetical protein IPK16_18820 [Anaerolineales bacterium]|nr:hypothetical protein [Anaerolineales bacterium]
MPGNPVIPLALSGWNKVLTLHLHLMQLGYQAAIALNAGDCTVNFALFGRMRTVTGAQALTMHLPEGVDVQNALRRFFDYFPQARSEVFDIEWREGEHVDAHGTPWFEARPAYAVKPMWRVLLNGKDLSYIGGPSLPLSAGDEIHVFPPGR